MNCKHRFLFRQVCQLHQIQLIIVMHDFSWYSLSVHVYLNNECFPTDAWTKVYGIAIFWLVKESSKAVIDALHG